MADSDNKKKKRWQDHVYVPPKLTKDEIMEFAVYAMKDPEVVRVITEQQDPNLDDKTIEKGSGYLAVFKRNYLKEKGRRYIDENGKDRKLGLAYSRGYTLIGKVIRGEIDSVNSAEARSALMDDHIISFVDEERS